ncbi:U-box domain-containing protein 27-like [Populus alba x Populus x berolinensis]|uniref:U-box domain-containing protein n=3 Tax=Populus TaxID=3689 RepID=A0A4U5R6Z9_POPAL|nr:U-box domain-containing protein 27-like [Populus alba]KAJ6954120.1 U-box domain-containing protein 27-like [Populus alba x Populus x berolinensis]KAJ7006457.1 U-box domain-containing protein 27-like [Populus alba x Populus x berolinensis]TKS18687.1 U-box domain-containing protein 28-like [Populus alba]
MGRDELCITVPSLFRCPISLDVMKSPVSLCTGVTYDRSSIQHWLDSGHDTCPATMQILSSKDFVPNLTLQRLINLWTTTAATKSSALDPAVSEEKVRAWIEEIKSGKIERCLDSIVEFVSCGEVSRRFLVSFDGFLEAIVGVLNTNCVPIRVLESVIRVLSSVLLENGVNEKLHELVFTSNLNCLPSFISVLRNGSLEYNIACVTVLESITINNQSKQLVAGTQDVLPVLLQLLKIENDHQDLNEVVLSFLISVSITRSIKTRLVQLGLVGVLSNMLLSQNAAVSVVEKSLKVLSMICTCADGRSAISVDPTCAGAIVERLMKVSKTATEDAVVVLWSMCCLFRDEKVLERVVRSNGVTKVLLIMQSEVGEGNVRRMCGDLIKVLRLGCKNGGGLGGAVSYETKTTHIMPC